jgi:hypothetical protein
MAAISGLSNQTFSYSEGISGAAGVLLGFTSYRSNSNARECALNTLNISPLNEWLLDNGGRDLEKAERGIFSSQINILQSSFELMFWAAALPGSMGAVAARCFKVAAKTFSSIVSIIRGAGVINDLIFYYDSSVYGAALEERNKGWHLTVATAFSLIAETALLLFYILAAISAALGEVVLETASSALISACVLLYICHFLYYLFFVPR